MDKIVQKIFILFIFIITCSLIYRFFIYKTPIKENIELGQVFEINTKEIYSIKGIKNTEFKITSIGASMNGYILNYSFKIDNKEYNKNNIDESEYIITMVQSDYKTKANFIITKKED